MGQKGVTEKRRHKRFKVKPNVFVEISSDLPHIGQLIDISKGGLSFRYIEREGPKACDRLKIYIAGNDYSLQNLKVKTISDIKIPSQLAHSGIGIRRQGVQFEDLSSENIESLDYFIEQHTVGEA